MIFPAVQESVARISIRRLALCAIFRGEQSPGPADPRSCRQTAHVTAVLSILSPPAAPESPREARPSRSKQTPLDHLPGAKSVYLRWQELEAGIAAIVKVHRQVAMEYSPRNANPYVSRVDAGLVELVRSYGSSVVSSGDLVQILEAVWDDDQWKMHQAAAVHTELGVRPRVEIRRSRPCARSGL